jgi:argininosuccinate lyase
MFTDAERAVRLVAAAMATATFDRGRLAERAEQGWITVTELADALTRDKGVPFKTSHAIATRLVAEADKRPSEPRSQLLHDVSLAVLGTAIDYDELTLAALLSARHFIDVRNTPGGPAPSETGRAIARSRELLAADTKWLAEAHEKLQGADQRLTEVAKRI